MPEECQCKTRQRSASVGESVALPQVGAVTDMLEGLGVTSREADSDIAAILQLGVQRNTQNEISVQLCSIRRLTRIME